MRRLWHWLTRNWVLKLTAVALAFVIWASYTSEPYEEVGLYVPLEFRNIPDGLEISGDVPVQTIVRVRGRSALLRRLSPADVDVQVDLRAAHAGETWIHFDPAEVTVPYGGAVVRVNPSEVRVKLTARTSPRLTP
jgi:YbbR domain-containing protein